MKGKKMMKGGRYMKGGHVKDGKRANIYNAEGSPEMHAAEDEEPGFMKGGRTKKMKKGIHAEGEMAKMRADKKPRTHKRAAGGRTPYSSGHVLSEPPKAGATNSGHESERP